MKYDTKYIYTDIYTNSQNNSSKLWKFGVILFSKLLLSIFSKLSGNHFYYLIFRNNKKIADAF